MKLQNVYKPLIAIELKKKGFEIVSTTMNYHNPKLTVYQFEASPELTIELNKLIAATKR